MSALLCAFPAWARVSVEAWRVAAHEDGTTRLVLDLSDPFEFHTRVLHGPERIVVDSPALSFTKPAGLGHPVGPITGLRYGEDGAGGHLEISLRHPSLVKTAFIIAPRDGLGWRLVVDMAEGAPERKAAEAPPPPPPAPVRAAPPEDLPPPMAAAPPPPLPPAVTEVQPDPVVVHPAQGGPVLSAPMPPPPARPQVAQPAAAPPGGPVVQAAVVIPEPMAKPKGDGRPMIVVDPGHGGVDPGATGVSGVYEKFITLAVARELAEQLERTGRYRVRLTRDRDVFIPLRDRVAIARQAGADLFVSLHADVVRDPQIRGLSVYTLSQNASDAEAQALADKENKADVIGGIDLSHESTDVANILIDLTQRETMNRSAEFAADIVDELGRDSPLLANTHRFAGFAVLKAPDVPAALVEMGYLSNETDERNLRHPDYRAKVAGAVARAVDLFFLKGQKAKRY